MIERGKADAVATLRSTRSALTNAAPSEPVDIASSLDDLRGRLAMKNGGAADSNSIQSADPKLLYQEYTTLLEKLHDPQLDPNTQMQMIERLTQLEGELQSLGIDVGESAPAG
jgi:hypothetical protein